MAAVNSTVYLHCVMGKVFEVCPPFRCVVTFMHSGKVERALLRVDKLVVNCLVVSKGVNIYEYLRAGSMVLFSAHEFDSSGPDNCSWFVTNAWRQDDGDLRDPQTVLSNKMFLGIYNAPCTVIEVARRQGVLVFQDSRQKDIRVLFQASKVFLFGKRMGSKHNLIKQMKEEDWAQFDAIPCDPETNDSHCAWIATLVWKGKKPDMNYDLPNQDQNDGVVLFENEYKRISSNPKSLFMRGKGRVMQLLTNEYGIAVARIRANVWESVLFHRKVCFLFKHNLGSQNLKEIYKEGDCITFVAAVAPKHLMTQWVATQINIDVVNRN